MKLLLISPIQYEVGFDNSTYDSYDTAYHGIDMTPATGLATVAALAPADFELTLCRETVTPIDFDSDVDAVGITVTVAQVGRALEIAQAFRERGKVVVMGGPHVSLVPELFDGVCDSIVVGELEAIAETFFEDMRHNRLKPRYDAPKADMLTSPAPRWDLYPTQKSMVGVVQTSRGCPFTCTFCDVVQFIGNKQRHKSNEQVLNELQILHDEGYGHVFISDDNFSANKKVARSLLSAIRDWNGADGRGFMLFQTQMSINTMRDDDFLTACYEAGLVKAYVGLETSDPVALAECDKRPNQNRDLIALCEKSYRFGVEIEPSLIVGFDSDDKTVFQRQLDFAQSLPTMSVRLQALVAPSSTPLYADIKKQGRLMHDIKSVPGIPNPYFSNFRPAQMTRAELYIGLRWTISRFFHPSRYLKRMYHIASLLQPPPWMKIEGMEPIGPRDAAVQYSNAVIRAARAVDPNIKHLIAETMEEAKKRPEIMTALSSAMVRYLAAIASLKGNSMYDPDWALMEEPPFDIKETDDARLQWLLKSDNERGQQAAE